MAMLPTEESKLREMKRQFKAFGRHNVTSLEQEHWHTYQRICAAGTKARPTTFAKQACEYCHEHVSRGFEECTGIDLAKPPALLRETFTRATTRRRIYKRSHGSGKPLFAYANQLRNGKPARSIPWSTVVESWDALGEAGQATFIDEMKVDAIVREASESSSNDTTEIEQLPAVTPWGIGGFLPTTVAMLKSFLSNFKTRAAGTKPITYNIQHHIDQ
jgi:hypothetical protein